ncbi:MAG TPA: DUF5916 domain-containing protein [Chitinophagales bacterium]|nr:DUF5916 domain-containing protein [Chitinophagales bacterium]HNI53601.1 DUF5916 domain-containing protein [Chitinophagales bacterium]HNJ88643.1 DUF5916 domain-containing protein [Chitinophagales bacterium]
MTTQWRLTAMCLLCTVVMQINAQDTYIPFRTSLPFSLDGALDEPDWQRTPVETAFMQQGPVAGATPTENTEVRIMYDNDYLYVGITCFDSEPDKLIRTELERDFPIGNEDGTGVTIDTYHDKLTGMDFLSNTLDARWDAQVTQDGGGLSESFNTFWDAKTKLYDFGYITEYRIPFSSLRFEETEQVTMGIRVARLIKRKNELITWPPCDPNTEHVWTNISFAKPIVFEGLQGGHPFYISPYAIASYLEFQELNAAGTAYEKQAIFMDRKFYVDNEIADKIISNIGLDVKYGISKNLTLDLTVNTDFAQAEVDDRIINLSKYEVNLPEKRTFFLESANALSFGFPSGNELFITRRIGNEHGQIVPILAGARITGKANGWLIGALNMQTTGLVTPYDTISPHNFTVLRTRKDIDKLGSFVGGIICNRIDTDTSGKSYQAIGLDIVKRITQQFTIEGGIANTMADLNAENFADGLYSHVGVFKSATSGFTYHSLLDIVGKDVNPVMGYLDEHDYGAWYPQIQYQWDLQKSDLLQYFYISADYGYRWKLSSGDRETTGGSLATGVIFENGASVEWEPLSIKKDSLFFDWELDAGNAISAGNYLMYNTILDVVLPTQSTYNISLGGTYGGFYGGDRAFAYVNLQYYISSHLNANLTYEFNDIQFDQYLDIDSATSYMSNLVRLGVNYNFSTKVSLKAYIQYEDISDMTSANLRFRYNPQEGTDLYIVLNQGLNNDRDRLDPKLPYAQSQAVTIKFTKTFAVKT